MLLTKRWIPTCMAIITAHKPLIQSFLSSQDLLSGELLHHLYRSWKDKSVFPMGLMTQRTYNSILLTKDCWIFVFQVVVEVCPLQDTDMNTGTSFRPLCRFSIQCYGVLYSHLYFQGDSNICNLLRSLFPFLVFFFFVFLLSELVCFHYTRYKPCTDILKVVHYHRIVWTCLRLLPFCVLISQILIKSFLNFLYCFFYYNAKSPI